MTKPAKQRPLPLLRNIRYPTYQLWAIAGDNKNQDIALKICILQTMQWLRERFREHELPKELDFPQPHDYKEVEFSAFTNIHLKHGYHLEIVWLLEEKIWALQLTEPDLGPVPGAKKQTRQPVAGRIFETNISFQASDKGITCGFQTMVSEPVGTTEICEVFRLSVIKELKRNPLIKLQQIWELKEEPNFIKSPGDIKNFKNKLSVKERTLPVIIASEYITPSTDTSPADVMPDLDKFLKSSININHLPAGHVQKTQKEDITEENNPALPLWLDSLAHNRMGYGHFFVISNTVRKEFCRALDMDLSNGGILFLPSPQVQEKAIHCIL